MDYSLRYGMVVFRRHGIRVSGSGLARAVADQPNSAAAGAESCEPRLARQCSPGLSVMV